MKCFFSNETGLRLVRPIQKWKVEEPLRLQTRARVESAEKVENFDLREGGVSQATNAWRHGRQRPGRHSRSLSFLSPSLPLEWMSESKEEQGWRLETDEKTTTEWKNVKVASNISHCPKSDVTEVESTVRIEYADDRERAERTLRSQKFDLREGRYIHYVRDCLRWLLTSAKPWISQELKVKFDLKSRTFATKIKSRETCAAEDHHCLSWQIIKLRRSHGCWT